MLVPMVEDFAVHLVSDGPGDAPPFVLTSGLGGAIADWDAVTRLLVPRARVLRFDRPGNGSSVPSRERVTLRREVAVLDAVLDAAAGPAVLVGHSLAGLHVEGYARLRPARVRGVVLVDPSLVPPGVGRPFDAGAVVAAAFVRCGLTGLAARCAGPLLRLAGRPPVRAAVVAELAAYPEMAAELDALRGAHPLPDVPWQVLTAGEALGRSPGRVLAAHESMAGLSPRGVHRVVPGSTHMMQLDQPEVVAEAALRCLAPR